MIRTYYCPNCRATIYCSDRFCGNCGVSLKWVEAQIPPAGLNKLDQKPGTEQQNEYQQQKNSAKYSHNRQSQKPLSVTPKKHLKENTNSKQTAVRNINKRADNSTEPLKNEVAKLLDGFLEKVA
jgi:hypothetical protein